MNFVRKYIRYIRSPEWAAKRAERLRIDNYQCQICTEPGEEVHHKHYRSLGNEDIVRLTGEEIGLMDWRPKFGRYEVLSRAIEDKGQVAILLTKPDLEVLSWLCEHNLFKDRERKERCKNLSEGMRRLLDEGFSDL